MIGIDVPVEHASRLNGLDRPHESFDSFRLATIAEVWYTLDEAYRFLIFSCQLGFGTLSLELCSLFSILRAERSIIEAKYEAQSTKFKVKSANRNRTLAMQDRFIDQRKTAWQRLEDLLKLLDSRSLRRLHRDEVRELGRIYRRTASDLAVARAESRDPRLINYLNSLVIRAHGRIYQADPQGGSRIKEFFARDFPQTFRRTWRYTAVSFGVFMTFGMIAFVGTKADPEFSELVGVAPSFRELYIETKTHWWEDLNKANQVGASAILTNNIQVTILTFAFGAFFAVGTLFYLAFNGANIASILALTYRAGFGNDLLTFMVGHGVIELSCIFMAGGAGLLIGSALLMPGDLSRADALKSRGKEAVRLMMGVAILLVVAGTIEGFISPAPIPATIKFSIGAITGLALYSYLLLAGRSPTGEQGNFEVAKDLPQ